MTITCPHCSFTRDIDDARIPAGTVRVACPRCKEKFAFSREMPGETATAPPAPPVEPAPAWADPVVPTAPLAADPAVAALPKAGFWVRVVASFVDSALLFAAMIFLGSLLFLTTGIFGSGLTDEGHLALGLLTQLFLGLLQTAYYVLFTGYRGQTPGKMVVRIRVVRADGGDVGYGTALLRETVGKFVSAIILGIGYLMVAFDRNKQGLHDKIASTCVVKI